MTNTSENLLLKVKYLLELAKSVNVNEAAVASGKAQELIDRYKLDIAEINAAENTGNEPVVDDKVGIPCGQRGSGWENSVLYTLCNVNSCKYYTNTTWEADRKRHKYYMLVGTATNVEIVKFMFAFLSVEIERLAQAYMHGAGKGGGKPAGNNFRLGAVAAISDRLKQSHNAMQQAYTGTQALVLVNRQEIEVKSFFDEFSKGMRKSQGYKTRPDASARLSGYKAGQSINLNTKALPAGGKLLNK